MTTFNRERFMATMEEGHRNMVLSGLLTNCTCGWCRKDETMTDTTTDLAAAIRAKVAEERAVWGDESGLMRRQCDLADAILARHSDFHRCTLGFFHDPLMMGGRPCPDIKDLAVAWGIETKENAP